MCLPCNANTRWGQIFWFLLRSVDDYDKYGNSSTSLMADFDIAMQDNTLYRKWLTLSTNNKQLIDEHMQKQFMLENNLSPKEFKLPKWQTSFNQSWRAPPRFQPGRNTSTKYTVHIGSESFFVK